MSTAIRRRIIKKEAKDTVFSNILSCVLLSSSFMLVLGGISGVLRFSDVYAHKLFSYNMFLCIKIFVRFTASLILIPVVIGYFYCFFHLAKAKTIKIYLVLSPFANKRSFFDSLKKGYCITIIFGFAVLLERAFFFVSSLILSYAVSSENYVVSALVKLSFLFVFVIIMTLMCGIVPYVFVDDYGLRQSFSCMKGRKTEFFVFVLSILPHFALAYLLPGIYLLFLIPYVLVSASLYVNFVICEKTAPNLAVFHEI